MHERLERHVKECTRHPYEEGLVRQCIEEIGYARTLDLLALAAINDRNEADKEDDESARSGYANLALKLLRASDEHVL